MQLLSDQLYSRAVLGGNKCFIFQWHLFLYTIIIVHMAFESLYFSAKIVLKLTELLY